MMKRILSMLLALLMLASVFPASAFAEDTTATTAATTEATTAPACDTCGNYDCASDHLTWCVICRKDDCGEDHVSAANLEPCDKCGSTDCAGHENWCDRCKTDNCGKEHKPCETCGTVDCTKEHKTCPTCGTVDCAKEHKTCETCGTVDCAKEHKACPTCSAVDCTADHTNWCDKCKKDNCGVEHNVLKKLLGSKSVTKTAEPCAYCEAAPNEAGVIEHTAQCNTKFSVDASADVGQTAIFTGWSEFALHADSKPNETFDYDLYDGDDSYDFQQAKYDNDNPPLVKIVDAHWEVSGPALWYRVEALDGESLPEGITSDSWIFQRYTNMQDPYNTLFFVDTSLLGKTVGFKNATAVLYSDIYRDDSKEVTQEALPVMVVEDIFHDGEKAWYYVNSENWPEEYEDYHFVPASAVDIVENEESDDEENATIQEKVTENEITVTVQGIFPEGTQLYAADVDADAEEFGIDDEDSIVAALDIKLLDAEGNAYQPYTDERDVKVELDAEALGLADGAVVKLHHKHDGKITAKEPFLVVDGKLTFYTDRFSIYLVQSITDTSTSTQIAAGNTYTITLGADPVIFYSDGLPLPNTLYPASNYNRYYVWSVQDENGVIDYTVHNSVRENYDWVGSDEYDARVAPWITVTPKKAGTATLTMTTAYQNWTQKLEGVTIGKETFTIKVVNPTGFHIENKIAEYGCLVPVGLENESGVTYTWTRSDSTPVRHEALVNTETVKNGINVSIDQGGVVANAEKTSYKIITYTVVATTADGTRYEDSYEVLYGSEILNSGFETPVGASKNWLPEWSVRENYGYVTNGTPGLFWKTTTPGKTHNLGRDIEFADEDSPHHAAPAEGNQYVELNAEGFGALYQDLLTTPGATLSWQFSHAPRYGADKNKMYVVMGPTAKAQEIENLDDIEALITAALAEADGTEIASSGSGLEFTYNGGNYRIWFNDANSGYNHWEQVSGYYSVPTNQYLTRLFFVSDPLDLNQNNSMGNLIDAVDAGETMSCVVQYYVDGIVDGIAEQGTLLRPHTKMTLERLGHYLQRYKYPVQILANGRPYPGTLADLQDGLYITDYGEKTEAVAGYPQSIVLQIYFQVPNIIATKTVEVVGMAPGEINNILNNGGFNAEFKLENKISATDTLTASVNITQFSVSNTLVAEDSFVDDQGNYVTPDDYGKTFTVSENNPTQLPDHKLVTTIKTGNSRDPDSEHYLKVGNEVTITSDNTIGFVDVLNKYYPLGDLRVSKFVQTNLDSIAITEEQKNDSFRFTVTLAGDLPDSLRGPYDYTIKEYKDGAVPTEQDQTKETGTLTLAGNSNTLTFSLKHNQYILIEDLPAGSYTITENLTTDQQAAYQEPNFIKENGVIPVGTEEDVKCYNTPKIVLGDLQITKTVEDNSVNQNAPKQPFVFTVTLDGVSNLNTEVVNDEVVVNSQFTVKYSCNTDKGTLTQDQSTYTMGATVYSLTDQQIITPKFIGDGSYTFTLTLYDGLTATIQGLPQCSYHVKEDDYSTQGFGTTYTGNTGTLGGQKVNGQNPVSVVTCINTYPMNTGNLLIQKTVQKEFASDPMAADEFVFAITPAQGSNAVLENGKTYTVKVEGGASKDATVSNNTLTVRIPFTAAEMASVTLNAPKVKKLTVYDLPMGEYTVTEQEDTAYNQGERTQTATVGATDVQVDYVNVFKRLTGSIKIKKVVEGTTDDDTFLFHLKGMDENTQSIEMDVTISGDGEITVKDLPIGTYSVTENTDWSWRYTQQSVSVSNGPNNTAIALGANEEVTVTFTNQKTQDQWLDYFALMRNEFSFVERR